MNASECCEKLLQQVKGSNLHYTLSENAFSVEIKIKKRFIDQKPASDLLQKSSSLQNQVSRNPFPGKKVLRKIFRKILISLMFRTRTHSTSQFSLLAHYFLLQDFLLSVINSTLPNLAQVRYNSLHIHQ